MWTQMLEEESGWGWAERGGHCCLPRGADCYADMDAEIVDHWEIEKKKSFLHSVTTQGMMHAQLEDLGIR